MGIRCGWCGVAANSAMNSAPWNAKGRSPPLEHQRQVTGVHIVEQRTGALVEHVGVEAFGLEQRDAPLPNRPLGLEGRKLDRELCDLLVEIVPGLEPVIAGIGVDPEIAD